MREVKFRAWHKDHGWCYFVIAPTEENKGHTISFGSEIYKHLNRGGLSDWCQYTGLHDKNGKEIYEGDIVRAASEGVWRTVEVRWRQDGAPPCYILYPAYDDGKFWNLYGSYVGGKGKCVDPCEVIGNIYENPELLDAR